VGILFCRRGWKFGRDVRVAGGGGEEILREVGLGFAERPPDAASEKVAEEIELPIFRTIAHGHKEYAAFAVHAGPNDWIGAALIALVPEHAGVDGADHVDVGGEIFQRIPFLVEGDRRLNALESGEGRIVDDDIGGLQAGIAGMNDKFAAEHAEIRIRLRAVSDVAVREIFRIGLGVKGVAGRVAADESEALLDGSEQSLLAGGRHGGILVGARFGEIAGGEEEDSLMSAKIL